MVQPYLGNARLPCVAFSSFPRQHDPGCAIHDRARQQDRVAHGFHAGDRTGILRIPVHDRGIPLVLAVVGEDLAFSGMEVRIVLEHDDSRGDGIECWFPGFKFGITRLQDLAQRLAHIGFIGRGLPASNDAGATVDDQCRTALAVGGIRQGKGQGDCCNRAESIAHSNPPILPVKVALLPVRPA